MIDLKHFFCGKSLCVSEFAFSFDSLFVLAFSYLFAFELLVRLSSLCSNVCLSLCVLIWLFCVFGIKFCYWCCQG